MKTGVGQVKEIYWNSSARILVPPDLIPAPGQYLLAHARESDSPVAIPLFLSEAAPDGFRAAPPTPSAWIPGARLNLRGPLGHGFALPASARKVALIAFDDAPERLRGLIALAFKQKAEAVLVCASAIEDIPEAVEVQPLPALSEIIAWADYVAADVARENLQQFKEALLKAGQTTPQTQILIRAPMPCGALAECGVCALTAKGQWKLICKEGPVFDMEKLTPP